MSVGIPSVPQTDAGMYSFLLALKQNIEGLQGGISSSTGGVDGTGTATTKALTSAGVYMLLSNPVLVLPAYSNGTVESFGTANGQASMFNGNVNVTTNAVFSCVASGCTGTVNTSQGVPVAGQPQGYYQITAMPGITGELTITGVVDRATISQIVNATQAQSGVEIVSSLPTTNLYQGRIVFLTTDNKLYRYDGSEWVTAVSAVDVTGQVTAAQIQDGIITTAKLLPGLQPVQLVTVLPPAGIAGRVVYLTADTQLYRDTGTAWTALVPAVNISGNITDAQIASLTAAKLTGQIVSTQITDGAISTPKLAAGSVTAANIAGQTIVAGNIAAGAIQTGQIAANAITTGQLAANSVTAGQIQAGAVTTNAMLANSITGDRIQAGTLAADKIFASSITAIQMAANSISALAIQSQAITADKILVGTITAAQIRTNTITAAQLAVSTLSAISANLGVITAGTIIFNVGGFMRVQGLGFGVSANLIEWFGPSLPSINLCSKTNAIDYLATDGTAYFGGNISITSGLNANGNWIQYPPNASGISYIEQFGTTVRTATDPSPCIFPLVFPVVCESWVGCPVHAGAGGLTMTLNGPPTTSGCSFYSNGAAVSWRCIGF